MRKAIEKAEMQYNTIIIPSVSFILSEDGNTATPAPDTISKELNIPATLIHLTEKLNEVIDKVNKLSEVVKDK